jgi:hypothetical protein
MGSKWPALKRTVPTYPPLYVSIARVVPTFFIMGACIELFMQKVPIGGRTFYDVALDKEVCATEIQRSRASTQMSARPADVVAYALSWLTWHLAGGASLPCRERGPGSC